MAGQPMIVEETSYRIVIVDDDDLFRESLGLNLAEEGYQIIDFADGESALEFLLGGEPADAVLLDWRMPGLDGLGVLRRMREARVQTPVIFLTMLSDEIYEEAALKWGAVDFIDKSRRLPIILQRLKIITEGAKPVPPQDVSFAQIPLAARTEPVNAVIHRGPLELRDDINRVFWSGKQVDLTLTEFTIVRFLITQIGNDVSYRQIYDIVRGKDFAAGFGAEGYRANVRSFIKRIRKKFREVDPDFDRIDNYPGFGYRWLDKAGEGGTD